MCSAAGDFEVWHKGGEEGFERGEEVNQREIRGWELWFVILGGSRIKSYRHFNYFRVDYNL